MASFGSVLGVHGEALLLHEKRGKLIANNLLNQDTPGFKPKDINFTKYFMDASSRMKGGRVGLNVSDAGHIPSKPGLSIGVALSEVETNIEKGQLAQSSMRYLASLKFLETKFKDLVTSIKGGSR